MAVDRGMREAVQQQVQRARAADLRDIIPKRSGTGTALDLKLWQSLCHKPSDLSDMFSPGDWVEATVEKVASDGKIYLTMRSNNLRLSPKVCAAIKHIQRRVELQHRQAYERRRW